MSSYTAEYISETIDRIVANTREEIGQTGPLIGAVYQGNNGRWVSAILTKYEHFLVDFELFGKEIAEENHRIIMQ